MTALIRNLRFSPGQYGRLFSHIRICCSTMPQTAPLYCRGHNKDVKTLTTVSCQVSKTTLAPTLSFNLINLEQRRFRKKRASKQDDDEEDDDEDDDELSNENPLLMDDLVGRTDDGSEYASISISSLRLDTFCKTAFSMTRAKVEELFYKGDIYLNGELPNKKSADLNVGDEIDVVKNIDAEDNKLVNVRRALILKLPDKASEHGRMKLDIQKWQNITIESRNRKG